MVIGLIDIYSALAFAFTAGVIGCAMVTHRDVLPRSTAALGAAAMIVMTVVMVGNALNSMHLSARLHESEELIEVLFLPLIAYFAYGVGAWSNRRDAERREAIVAEMGERLDSSLVDLGEARLETLRALSAAVDARDHYTALHSMHVADYARAIGFRLGLEEQLQTLEQAGLLHDIGKVGVPDHVLLKPTGLTAEEYETVKRHAADGASIVGTVPSLAGVVDIIRHHHERWDGSGYPDKLAGEDIPFASRILAVADAFDAMTTDRPYRTAFDLALARKTLLEGCGSQFDPTVCGALIALLDEAAIEVQSAG